MSQAYFDHRHDHSGKHVPFSEFTDAFKTAGDAIFEAFAGAYHFAARAAETVAEKSREVKTARALSELSDHTLRDIGVHRSEIRYVAQQVAKDPNFDPRAKAK